MRCFRRRPSPLVLAVLAACAAASMGLARPDDPKPALAKAAAAPGALPTWIKPSGTAPNLYDVDFPGGTIGEYYRGLASAPQSSNPISIIVSAEGERVQFQPITLHGAGLRALAYLPPKLMPGVALDEVYNPEYKDAAGAAQQTGVYIVGVDSRYIDAAKQRGAATFDLDFPGGSVGAYVDAIRKVCPAANVVLLDGAEKMNVPALKFRAVTVGAAMMAIERNEQGPNGSKAALIVRTIGMDGTPESVYKVHLESTPPGSNGEERVHVWSLAPSIAAGVKVEDALSAIDAALAVDQRPVTIKYHEATNLLIVRATEQQHKVIDDVIHEVEYTVQVREGAKEPKK